MARECILCRVLRGLTPQRCAVWLVGLALLCMLPMAFGADPLRLALAPLRLAQAGAGAGAGTGTPRLPDLPPEPAAAPPASAPAASAARPAAAPAVPAPRPASSAPLPPGSEPAWGGTPAPAPAAKPATPAPASAAPAPRPAASPARPPASAPLPAPLPIPSGGALPSMPFFGTSTLHLLANPVPLPPGRTGVPYKPVRIVLGGIQGYHVRVEGGLPPGMELSDDGYLQGTPIAVGGHRFAVRVFDSATPPASAQQAYTLRILGPATPARPASAPAAAVSGPKPPKPLTVLTEDDTKALPNQSGPSVWAWKLTQADLDKLLPDPTAPLPPDQQAAAQAEAQSVAAQLAGSAGAAAPPVTIPDTAKAAADAEALRVAQQRQMMASLVEAEFPSRGLFEAALNAQLCWHVYALIEQAERNQRLPLSGGAGVVCPPAAIPAAQVPAKGASAPKPAAPAAAPPPGVPVAELPAWLLPAALRQEAIAAAEKRYFLSQAKPPQLTDGNCGCVHEDMVGETYGFYPFWAAAGKPQQVDFSLHTRMAFHAATFGDDGGLRLPASWEAGAEFAVQAERHGTKLDLVVWRNDWTTLLALDDTRLERAARELARSAVAAADTPLRDAKMRWSRFMPFSSPAPTAADGITVFFDNMPNAATNPAGAQAFASFVRRFMLALIAQMRAGAPRDYGLNIALTAQQIGKAPFDYEALFDYVKRAEEPRLDNERIREDGDVYRSRTNVTVRFVVLLPEPTTLSKKALRKSLEDVRDIYGNDRRILLRKIIAAISYNGADPQQFADDLAYFRDNFGGAGFWQMPVHGTAVGDASYETIARTFRKDATDQTTALCKLVCTNRWAARAVFHLLVVLQIVALLGVIAAGGLRCVGKRPSLGLLALAVALVLTGGSLLNCDPDFKSLREGNALFWATLALLFAAALFTTVRPRDPKP